MPEPRRHNIPGHAWSIWCYFDSRAPERENAAWPPERLREPEAAIGYMWSVIQRLKAVVETQADALHRPITINVNAPPDDEEK